MPTYEYECECGHRHEEFRSLKAPPPKKCPSCGLKFGKGYSQVFSAPSVIVRGLENAKTFGQAAEENARRVGSEGLERMESEDRARVAGFTGKLPEGARLNTTAAATPPWRDGSMGLPQMEKPLDVSKVKDVKRYISHGEV